MYHNDLALRWRDTRCHVDRRCSDEVSVPLGANTLLLEAFALLAQMPIHLLLENRHLLCFRDGYSELLISEKKKISKVKFQKCVVVHVM